jgi:hypothetical protein
VGEHNDYQQKNILPLLNHSIKSVQYIQIFRSSFHTYLNFSIINCFIFFRVWEDKSFWNYEDQTKHDYNKDGDYYGIKGLKRVHNGWIAVLCIVFSAIGVCLQLFLIQ